MDRRTFLKLMVAGQSGLALGLTPELARAAQAEDFARSFAVLVDTTKCIGCHECEKACAEINEHPQPDLSKEAVKNYRYTSDEHFTVVNGFETEKGLVYLKKQCMHCADAACVSACPVGAFEKHEEGPVEWHKNCFGCRYCMVACPFDIPKFEYDTPIPQIKKCTFCYETRLLEGKEPACVSACEYGALTFGLREDMIAEAHRRIDENPGTYNPHLYGETDVGGTNWLYLASVPFDQLGFKTNLGDRPVPDYSRKFLSGVHAIDVIAPPVLFGMAFLAKRKSENSDDEE